MRRDTLVDEALELVAAQLVQQSHTRFDDGDSRAHLLGLVAVARRHVVGEPAVPAQTIHIEKHLHHIPQVDRTGQHIPVPLAGVVVEVDVEKPVGLRRDAQHLRRGFFGDEGVAHVHRHADVGEAQVLAQVERAAHISQDAVVARFVELVLQADAHVAAILRGFGDARFQPAPLLEIVGLEAVVVPVDERAAGDHPRIELRRQVHRDLHIGDGVGAQLRIGRGERAGLPLVLRFDVEVHRRHFQAGILDPLHGLLDAVEIAGVDNLDPIHTAHALCQFQALRERFASLITVKAISDAAHHP